MTIHPDHRKLAKALDLQGGLYTVSDVFNAIAEGKMQSFVVGDLWMVTQIVAYPRGRALEILFAVGALPDCMLILDKISDYAREQGIAVISTVGRQGWVKSLTKRGWKVKRTVIYFSWSCEP